MVIGNAYGQSNEIYRNDGTGIFIPVHQPAVTEGAADTRSVAMGDFDLDG